MTVASFVAYSSDDKLATGGYQGREVYAKRYDKAKVAKASEARRIKLTVREKESPGGFGLFFSSCPSAAFWKSLGGEKLGGEATNWSVIISWGKLAVCDGTCHSACSAQPEVPLTAVAGFFFLMHCHYGGYSGDEGRFRPTAPAVRSILLPLLFFAFLSVPMPLLFFQRYFIIDFYPSLLGRFPSFNYAPIPAGGISVSVLDIH